MVLLFPVAVFVRCGENRRYVVARPDAVFIDIGVYPSEAAAQADYDIVKNLHAAGVIGILFPPAILATTAVGAAVGGVSGHLWRGMSRADVRELGELIDDGQAALVIVGESKLEEAVDKAALKAEKHVAKELNVKPKDVDRAVREAATEVS
jgi:Protein of unknown function (DUF1269)